jgi:hypothetical protein
VKFDNRDKTKLQINNEDEEKVAKLTQKSHTQVLKKTRNSLLPNREIYSSKMKESKRSPDIKSMNNTYT